jgi:hypothetical protein
MLYWRHAEQKTLANISAWDRLEVSRSQRTFSRIIGVSASQNDANICLGVWIAEFGVIDHEAFEAQLYFSATNNLGAA